MPATNGTSGDAFAIHNEGAFLFTVSLSLRRRIPLKGLPA